MGQVEEAIADLEHNMWSMFSVLGIGTGGAVTSTPTRLVVTSPVLRPPYNAVWRFYDEGDRPLEQQVREVIAPLEARGAQIVWVVHPTAPAGLRDGLTAVGLTQAETLQGMSATLDDLPPIPDTPPDVTVTEGSRAHTEAWLHLVTWRYGLDRADSPYLREIYDGAIGVHTRMWIAEIDGEPVSKAAMHIDDRGVAGIYAVVTTEGGRRRGLATLLTLHALNAARDQDVRRSVLHSTPMAAGLYRSLGFSEVAPFEVWAAPGSLHL